MIVEPTVPPGVYDDLNKVKMLVMKAIQGRPTPSAQNLGRQCLDHLDAATLFLNQFGYYLDTVDQRTEEAAATAAAEGKIHNFPGPAGGENPDAD